MRKQDYYYPPLTPEMFRRWEQERGFGSPLAASSRGGDDGEGGIGSQGGGSRSSEGTDVNL
jgi:hypothetical protein